MVNKQDGAAADEKHRMQERLVRLGVPTPEMTDSVTLALSALLEKLDDVTAELERARHEFEELEGLVDVDCLVPVPNRRAFMRRLTWIVSMRQRYGYSCSILYFDINDFKKINDTYGHAAGDEVIRHLCQLFQKTLRGSDFMARLGGDEFAIIMYYAQLKDAGERGRKIAEKLAGTPVTLGSKQFTVTTAYGAYEIGQTDTPEQALDAADAEMYRNKTLNKERILT